MVSLETETDRTLFFDLLPLDVGNIAGFKTRFQLYTVPGQVFYNSTRKLVLRGVDGIVFVADSQLPMMDANVESLSNLRGNLAELGLNMDEIPLVFQYNKRDLKSITSVEELNQALNPNELPFFEASALNGNGVFETLKGISKATLIMLRRRALGEDKVKIPEIATKPLPPERSRTPVPASPPAAAGGPTPSTVMPSSVPVSVPSAAAAPVAVSPTQDEIASENVEFSEVPTQVALKQPTLKKISVSKSDIASKLDALRDIYTASPVSKGRKSANASLDALAELLGETDKEVKKKLKIRLDPAELAVINNLSLDFHLTGGTLHKRFSNAMNVSVEGKSNPKKVVLKIEVEILKK